MSLKVRNNPLDSRISQIVYSYSHKLSDIEIEQMIDKITEIIRRDKSNGTTGKHIEKQSIGVNADKESD